MKKVLVWVMALAIVTVIGVTIVDFSNYFIDDEASTSAKAGEFEYWDCPDTNTYIKWFAEIRLNQQPARYYNYSVHDWNNGDRVIIWSGYNDEGIMVNSGMQPYSDIVEEYKKFDWNMFCEEFKYESVNYHIN